MTLISESKPASQVTPSAVQLGWGASGKWRFFTAMMVSNWFSGPVWKLVTSTMSAKPHARRRQRGPQVVEGEPDVTREVGLGRAVGAAAGLAGGLLAEQ